jgi:hypothetical protein
MGITKYDTDLLERVVIEFAPRSCIELGAQYLYSTAIECLEATTGNPHFAKEWFLSRGMTHCSIDLNGEADLNLDLTIPISLDPVDLVTNFGTIEHTSDAYASFTNVHGMTKTGGIMVHENPKIGNWKGHGNWYFTRDFYTNLSREANYEIIELDEVAAMGNITDGWNICCVMRKLSASPFISRETFNTLGIQTI